MREEIILPDLLWIMGHIMKNYSEGHYFEDMKAHIYPHQLLENEYTFDPPEFTVLHLMSLGMSSHHFHCPHTF